MNSVSKNVIRDLLPIYLSGEASAETKNLVESFLTTDKELAEEARLAGSLQLPAAGAPRASAEKIALETTKKLLRVRAWILAMALFFTGLPLSFAAHGAAEITFFLIRDEPAIGLASWAAAAALWICFAMIHRRLRVSNL
jgi:anti-sigma factor RsiW